MRVPMALLAVAVTAYLAAGAASSAVVISKIQFDPPGSDRGSNVSLNNEWVELKNTGGSTVALDGWTLRDRDAHVYTFGSFTLKARATVRVHTGRASDGAKHVYWDFDGYVWNNDGDTASLKNSRGTTVDTCKYSGSGSSVIC